MATVLLTDAELVALVQRAVEPLREEIERLRARLDEETLSVAEAARRLHTTPRSVQRSIKAGDLPAVKVGRAFRIPLSEVLASHDPLARRSGRS
jgi:excisionase family DNA binding protein